MKGVGNHIRTHVHDTRGPYQCAKCSYYFADRYTLALHDQDCNGQGYKPRNAQMLRIPLSKSDSPPRVIIITRSSAKALDE